MRIAVRLTRMRRAALATTVGAALALTCAGVASAHVTVNPSSATKGSYTTLTFRVPNELANANTTELDVQLLQNPKAPIPNVSVRPVPGWTATVTTEHLATPVQTPDGSVSVVASVVKWTGGVVKPGEFQEFEVSAGPLPSNVDELIFPAVQFYSNGQTVRWVDLPSPGGTAPEHPAPVLHLLDAGAPSPGGSVPEPTRKSGLALAASPSVPSSSTGLATVAVILGAIGVVLGAAAVVLALRKSPKTAAPGATRRGSSPQRTPDGEGDR